MANHIIPLPGVFRYLNQFQPSQWSEQPSLYRCVAASAAMLAEIAYPGRWIPEELEHDIYTKLAGPDVPTDKIGITKDAILNWFKSVDIGYYDNASYLNDHTTLLEVMQRQNDMNVPQMITVANENLLVHAVTKQKLHNWIEPVDSAAHTFIRIGYSDTDGYGLYYEPAAPGFAQPVPISWSDSIEQAGVITCVAIMPSKVAAPPSNFDWLHNTWPEPVPQPRVSDALSTIEAIKAAYASEDARIATMKAARDSAFEKIIADLMA